MENDSEKTSDLLDQLTLPRLKFSAQRGNPTAQSNLATHLVASGDYSSAAIWYRFAAQQGNALAQHNLGCLLLNGEGVEQDFIEAAKWFSEAAQQGYTNAIYNLAFVNEHGLGCKMDKVRACSLYEKAADRGDPDSLCKLAMLLLDENDQKRIGIEPQGDDWPISSNPEKARELLELASRNGHKTSTNILKKLGWK